MSSSTTCSNQGQNQSKIRNLRLYSWLRSHKRTSSAQSAIDCSTPYKYVGLKKNQNKENIMLGLIGSLAIISIGYLTIAYVMSETKKGKEFKSLDKIKKYF